MTAIQIQSLTKEYDAISAVRNLNLEVERGEVFGFLGPNGAGKSTTINMLLDFVRPTSGSIRILGHDPQKDPGAVRKRIGVLPEASAYYDRFTARKHVEFAVKMKNADADPNAILQRVGLTDAANRAVGEFSKGMRQRLGVGLALVDRPELIILDEPLSGLDPHGAQLLRRIVREERDRGATIFFSSHIMDQVETICDRVGILHDGELLAVDTVEALRASFEQPSTFVVSVDSPPENHSVETVDGVSDVTVRDGALHVTYADPTVKTRIIEQLKAAGATVEDVSTERPSLERLFVEVTNTGE